MTLDNRVIVVCVMTYACVICAYPMLQQYYFNVCKASAWKYIFFNDSMYCVVLSEVLRICEMMFLKQRGDVFQMIRYLNGA